jgi:hypothetical protein
MYSDATIMREKPQVAAWLAYVLNNAEDGMLGVGYFKAPKRSSKRACRSGSTRWETCSDPDRTGWMNTNSCVRERATSPAFFPMEDPCPRRRMQPGQPNQSTSLRRKRPHEVAIRGFSLPHRSDLDTRNSRYRLRTREGVVALLRRPRGECLGVLYDDPVAADARELRNLAAAVGNTDDQHDRDARRLPAGTDGCGLPQRVRIGVGPGSPQADPRSPRGYPYRRVRILCGHLHDAVAAEHLRERHRRRVQHRIGGYRHGNSQFCPSSRR